MSALNAAAKAALRDAGVTQAGWARAHGQSDGRWHGDACGCPDDRCAGYHHDADEDCGCLDVLLVEYVSRAALPEAESRLDIAKANLIQLAAALSGIELGGWDRSIVEWLADYEPSTVAVICGLISRARQAATAGPEPFDVAAGADPLAIPANRIAEAGPGKLAAIQLVLDQVLGDELADRQYALEQIHDILRGDL